MRKKDTYLNIRVSAEELETIKAKAEAKHLTTSAYVRMVLLTEKGDK